MKAILRKCGKFAALAAVFLLTVTLVTNCMDAINWSGIQLKEVEKKVSEADVPEEMGVISINVSSEVNARTIFPDIPWSSLNDLYYSVQLERTAPTPDAGSEDDLTLNGPITVVPGTYTIKVWAFMDALRDEMVLTGEEAGVVIAAGADESVVITLREIVNGNGDGTFEWDFTLPGATNAPDTATMDIWCFDTTSNVKNNIDILTRNPDEEDLPSGYYRVTVHLNKALHQSVSISVIVHIYENMTSTYDRTFTALNRNHYNVEFRNNDNAVLNTNTSYTNVQEILHGSTITQPSPNPIHSVNAFRTFAGWFTVQGDAGGTQWAFGGSGTRLIRDTILYARYEAATTISVGVSFVADNLALALNVPAISYPQADIEATSLSFTINNYATFDGGIKLLYKGSEVTTAAAGAITLALNSDLDNYEVAGIHIFTIEAVSLGTGPGGLDQVYSGTFTLTVTP